MKRRQPIRQAPWERRAPKVPYTAQIDPKLRAEVHGRAGGRCELCGEALGPAWQAHHRKFRSRGGQDSVCNLVALHPMCHRRVHGHSLWATEQGFIVSSYDDPASVPVALHLERWVLLTLHGYRDAA